MIGVGPYLPHSQTPFAGETAGSLDRTLRILALLRLFFPRALLPSTTALATIHPRGRLMGILAGANESCRIFHRLRTENNIPSTTGKPQAVPRPWRDWNYCAGNWRRSDMFPPWKGAITMYDVKSKRAEEFISDEEILDTLAYAEAHKKDRKLIRSLLKRAEDW